FFSSRRRHTRFSRDWSSDVCSSDLAVMFGHKQMQVAINAINELVAEAGKPKWTWAAPAADANMVAALKAAIGDRLTQAFAVRDKIGRASCRERSALSGVSGCVATQQ